MPKLNTSNMEQVFSTFQIARVCRVTPRTVANWIDDGLIKSFKTPGRYRKVLRSNLEAFCEKNNIPMDGIEELESSTILVIDDDTSSVKDFKNCISESYKNISIEIAHTIAEGLMKVATENISMIFLNIGLKGFDIANLVKQFKKTSIKIIPVIDNEGKKNMDNLEKLKMKKYLVKPISSQSIKKFL